MINPVEKCRLKENNAAYKTDRLCFLGVLIMTIKQNGVVWYGKRGLAYRLIVEVLRFEKEEQQLIIQHFAKLAPERFTDTCNRNM